MRTAIFTTLILIAICIVPVWSCKPKQISNPPVSTSQTEPDASKSIDWSTVTTEEIWRGVFAEYQSSGPKNALEFLQTAMQNSAITEVEGEQVRAMFLNELGKIDEAFIAISGYKLDESHPDLLRLRAEILWSMGRYEGAKSDYDKVIEAQATTVMPDVLLAVSRLYDDMGLWDQSGSLKNQLRKDFPNDSSTLALNFQESLESDDPVRIEAAKNAWVSHRPEGAPIIDSLSVIADASMASLNGSPVDGARVSRDFLSSQPFDVNVALTMLRLDVEAGDFVSLETDIRMCFTQLKAIDWLDTPAEGYPSMPDHPLAVAKILDWASTLALGNGDRIKARLLADRALELDPYDYSADQQMALVNMADQDTSAAFESIAEALKIAPPSDIRTRLRAMQLSVLATDKIKAGWDNAKVKSEVAGIVAGKAKRYPGNVLYQFADAEIKGSNGDLAVAEKILKEACALPGATRDMSTRWAYYLCRLGRDEDAWAIVQREIQPNTPYLTWVTFLGQEALARSDKALAGFASRVRDYIDPGRVHDDFFVAKPLPPPEEETPAAPDENSEPQASPPVQPPPPSGNEGA
jgi:tetratricopeptide (TPR) repeat protein